MRSAGSWRFVSAILTDPGLYERRKRLRALFRRVPVADTRALHARLGERPTGDALSKSFHGRPSTPTRRELLKILADRFPPVLKEPPEPEPAVVFPSNPLPVAAEERFRAAVVALRDKVRITSDPRAHRYRCWLGGGLRAAIGSHQLLRSLVALRRSRRASGTRGGARRVRRGGTSRALPSGDTARCGPSRAGSPGRPSTRPPQHD